MAVLDVYFLAFAPRQGVVFCHFAPRQGYLNGKIAPRQGENHKTSEAHTRTYQGQVPPPGAISGDRKYQTSNIPFTHKAEDYCTLLDYIFCKTYGTRLRNSERF